MHQYNYIYIPCKSLGLVMLFYFFIFFKEVSYIYQVCIYLIKNLYVKVCIIMKYY